MPARYAIGDALVLGAIEYALGVSSRHYSLLCGMAKGH
jgi:hypothetical protein